MLAIQWMFNAATIVYVTRLNNRVNKQAQCWRDLTPILDRNVRILERITTALESQAEISNKLATLL